MTSKEIIRDIQRYLYGYCEPIFDSRSYYYKLEEVEKDLEVLDYIKLLVSNYNNGELGYINFTQEVIEVVVNDKNNL